MSNLAKNSLNGAALALIFALGTSPAMAQDQGGAATSSEPTIDTNGDGTADAWDLNGDGKPDAWDTDGNKLALRIRRHLIAAVRLKCRQVSPDGRLPGKEPADGFPAAGSYA